MPGEKGRGKKKIGDMAARIAFSLAALFLSLTAVALALTVGTDLPLNSIAPGVTVGPVDVGGLSYADARRLLIEKTQALEKNGVRFVGAENEAVLSAVLRAETQEQAAVVFDYDVDDSLVSALEVGRRGRGWEQVWERLQARLGDRHLPLSYNFDEIQARAFLAEKFIDSAVFNASFRVVERDGKMMIEVSPEVSGIKYDLEQAMKDLRRRLSRLDGRAVTVRYKIEEPQVRTAEAEALKKSLDGYAALGDLILIAGEDKKFAIPTTVWLSWITTERLDGHVELVFDRRPVEGYLKAQVVPQVEIPFQEAKFTIEGNRVKDFQSSRVGKAIDYEALLANLRKSVLANNQNQINLTFVDTAPQITTDQANTLGIKEIVGVGQSNFWGSPVNRKYNIRVGANTLHGLLIAPGEVFSLVKALGEIDAEHGYRQELVIKGNKTLPEYGGGLCQVATTIFRSALASGLPITERQSHAYRVSYYEPAGVDATIYIPQPDLRFINDTGHHILIQSKIEGNNLSFEFWGTKDNRTVVQTKPVLYNFKAPPTPQLIETLDLPVGQKKCTEKAHTGADASFNYTVTSADGMVKKQDIVSHYRPWGEVCLIGVEKLSVPVDGATASSTEESLPLVP